jgi:hypothetical protein
VIASGLLMHAKGMGSGALSIVAFGIALGCPKHGGCASGRQKVEMFCVSIELGKRLLFKEVEREMMSNLCRVLRLLSFVHIIYKGGRRLRVAGCWCPSSRCHHWSTQSKASRTRIRQGRWRNSSQPVGTH